MPGQPADGAVEPDLFGLIGFEVFGQFNRLVEDRDTFFRHAVGQLAHTMGLVYPQQGPADGPGGRAAEPS